MGIFDINYPNGNVKNSYRIVYFFRFPDACLVRFIFPGSLWSRRRSRYWKIQTVYYKPNRARNQQWHWSFKNRSWRYVLSFLEKSFLNLLKNPLFFSGFSQGGALSLYTGLTGKYKLSGIIALSCWLPLHKTFPGALNTSNAEVHILQAHGDCDPVVPYRWGQMTSTAVKGYMKNHEFKTYKGLAHSSGSAEMQDIRQFLQTRLPPVSPWAILKSLLPNAHCGNFQEFSVTQILREIDMGEARSSKIAFFCHFRISDFWWISAF